MDLPSSDKSYPAERPRTRASASHRPWLSLLDQAGLLNKPRARQGRPRWREERRAGSLLRHPAAQHVPILFDQVVAQPAGCGATGILPVILAMQFFNPRIAQTKFQPHSTFAGASRTQIRNKVLSS